MGRLRTVFLTAAVLPLATACSSLVEPRASYGTISDRAGLYAGLESTLERFVDADGLVDYGGLAEDPAALERQYSWFASVGPDDAPGRFPSKNDRLAYWINGYNTAVLVSATRSYPIESVEDVGVPWYLFFLPDLAGFFYVRTHRFGGGVEVNLQDLENEIVRARFADPRIHFALNCASLGCPRLPRRPFVADRLDVQLDTETRRFFGDPTNLHVDHMRRVIHLSPILDWYRGDFANESGDDSDKVLVDFVSRFGDLSAVAGIRELFASGYTVRFLEYDWGLNDRAGRGRRAPPAAPGPASPAPSR